ncbi:DUF3857 domain-containing protein [Mucilaginibacter phyllosphaerae]|uniref:DUF3857 domain-containing protein n=1 Tax=Mucilaginibacter phyllosphaerae TaxID=1812349 RepID=A0A4Y8ADX2_9SPHI|nr:DUF3857 domain-containing protein [Mucilaginibacter phyllosphaerae]MBB3970387.1 hypothetical protein [Mucilaginibacter phyllosphaerae]TEW66753.1 DUF3857 domain-containing protein [Mucilaginibacter phyllosphaerae]GGH11696.1 hypothetical protein GCM10007352_18080 [Mucilaginibacter phyllosphaerae]
MHKLYFITLLCAITLSVKAQTAPPTTQPFGKIDIADLELKDCDFEKGANAEVLFNKGNVYYNQFDLNIEIHKRIKIFTDKGKDNANIKIIHASHILTNLQAQTINLNHGAVEYIKVDKTQIYTEKIDKWLSATVFTFPNVKPGSVIEFKYLINTNIANYPNWYFQTSIPTRYSEITTLVSDIADYKTLDAVTMPYAVNKLGKNDAQIKALANIPSISDEAYMTTIEDNSQRLLFQLSSVTIPGQKVVNFAKSWPNVGEEFAKRTLLSGQLDVSLSKENALLAVAKAMKTDEQKIAYLFNEVKKNIMWNGAYNIYAYNEGINVAWNKKTGNSAEVNLILCRLLKKSGVKVYPMVVSTRNNGRVSPTYPNSSQFNSTVAFVPVDSTKFFVLDATNKYNIYNQIPANLLNSFGLYIDKEKENYRIQFLEQPDPVKQVILVNGDITTDGKVTGTAEIDNYSYNKITATEKFKKDGESKFISYLTHDDNNLKISSLEFEDMDIDTLPLKTKVSFTLDLTGSDNNYIYFCPNILTSIKANPFLNTRRLTDVDFGYRDNYSIIGSYKIPTGYKVDILPKSVSLIMPDKSILFKRTVVESNGAIIVRYTIDHKKSIYFKEDYPEFHEFTKQMYEMLNEQIVLKKS